MLANLYHFKTIAFAKPLKDGLKAMLNLTDEHVHGSLKETVIEDFGKSPRQMLQTLGTDWGRMMVHDDLWLIVAKRQIESWLSQGYNVAVTDVRFDNEGHMIHKLGGSVWHISRPSLGEGVVNAHVSEAGTWCAKSVDSFITNDSTLEALQAYVEKTYLSYGT